MSNQPYQMTDNDIILFRDASTLGCNGDATEPFIQKMVEKGFFRESPAYIQFKEREVAAIEKATKETGPGNYTYGVGAPYRWLTTEKGDAWGIKVGILENQEDDGLSLDDLDKAHGNI